MHRSKLRPPTCVRVPFYFLKANDHCVPGHSVDNSALWPFIEKWNTRETLSVLRELHRHISGQFKGEF